MPYEPSIYYDHKIEDKGHEEAYRMSFRNILSLRNTKSPRDYIVRPMDFHIAGKPLEYYDKDFQDQMTYIVLKDTWKDIHCEMRASTHLFPLGKPYLSPFKTMYTKVLKRCNWTNLTYIGIESELS